MCSNDDSGVNNKIDITSFESYILNILGCSSIQKLKCTFDKYKNNTVLVVNNNNGLNFNVTKEMKTQYMIEAYEKTKNFFIERQIQIKALADSKKNTEENTSNLDKNENENIIDTHNDNNDSDNDNGNGSDTDIDTDESKNLNSNLIDESEE